MPIPAGVILGAKIAAPIIGGAVGSIFGRRKKADLPFVCGLGELGEQHDLGGVIELAG